MKFVSMAILWFAALMLLRMLHQGPEPDAYHPEGYHPVNLGPPPKVPIPTPKEFTFGFYYQADENFGEVIHTINGQVTGVYAVLSPLSLHTHSKWVQTSLNYEAARLDCHDRAAGLGAIYHVAVTAVRWRGRKEGVLGYGLTVKVVDSALLMNLHGGAFANPDPVHVPLNGPVQPSASIKEQP